MSRRQKKKQEKKRLAKIGILSQKEIQKQRLKEAKREARERRKGIPTRKEREKGIELAEKLSDLFENDTVEKTEVDNKHEQRDITTETVCLNNITYEVTKEYFADSVGHYEFKVTPKRGAELVVNSMVSDECVGKTTIMERGINASSRYRFFVVYPDNK